MTAECERVNATCAKVNAITSYDSCIYFYKSRFKVAEGDILTA